MWENHMLYKILVIVYLAVADPGFPVGGVDLVGGALTPEAATFHKICMSKRKNRVP